MHDGKIIILPLWSSASGFDTFVFLDIKYDSFIHDTDFLLCMRVCCFVQFVCLAHFRSTFFLGVKNSLLIKTSFVYVSYFNSSRDTKLTFELRLFLSRSVVLKKGVKLKL
jgi:hypothetical protein